MLIYHRPLFILLIASLLLTGCNHSPFHKKWACESGSEQLKLRCEASKNIPWFRSAEHLHTFDLCQPKTMDYELNLELSWRFIESEGHYAAIGGYCDFNVRLAAVIDHLDYTDAQFQGMLFQIYSCDPLRYEELSSRVESLGLTVRSYRFPDCE